MRKKHRLQFNIGLVIFGAIFIYLIIMMVLYITHRRVDTYQVISGPLTGNDTFTAFIARDEELVLSTGSGYVNHFFSDGSKAGKGQLVCSVSTSTLPLSGKVLTDTDYADFKKLASDFSRSFDMTNYRETYGFKQSVTNLIWDAESVNANSGTFYVASEDGYVSFSSDGYETFSESMLSVDMFRASDAYVATLPDKAEVVAGSALYRVIKGEEWSLYFPITDKQTVKLGSRDRVRVKFLKDGNTETGKLSYIMAGDQRYGKLTFSNGAVRYADLRFVNIELITNTESGLKIPLTSVVNKEFYTVPEELLCYSGDDGNDAGFYREVYSESGSRLTEFVAADLYAYTTDSDGKGYYYVDMSVFNAGDVLTNPLNSAKYTIGKTELLQGVYCVNKGYAVFRRINILDKNDEYCIVASNTSYGITRYDYIVRDASKVRENDIIYYS